MILAFSPVLSTALPRGGGGGLWPCHALCLEGFPVSLELKLLTFPFSSQLLQDTFPMC